MENCELILGVRGFGKSIYSEGCINRNLLRNDCAQLVIDRPGTLMRAVTGRAVAKGHKNRVLVEQAARLDRTLSWPFWQAETFENPLEQLNADEIADEQFAQAFLAKRGLKDAEEKPWTKQYLMAGIAVYRSQPAPCHLSDILAPFELGHPRRNAMLDQARDRGAARMFRDLEFRSMRSPNTYAVESGAAYRMLLICRSPALYARNGNSIDWEWVIENKIQVFMDLSGVSVEVARALGIFAYTGFNNALRRVSHRRKKQMPGVVWLEESGVMDYCTPYVLTSCQEDRKWGSAWKLISQTVEDFKGDMFEKLMGVVEESTFFRLNTGIERAAAAIANPTYDPNAVHRIEEHYGVIGHENKTVINEGERLDKDGKVIGKDRRKNDVTSPIYGGIKKEIMKTPQLHHQDKMTDLATLGIGQCIKASMNGVQLINVKMEPQPWPLGLSEHRTERAIQEMRSRPQYRQPNSPTVPAPVPPTSPSPPPSSPEPRRRGGAAERFGGNETSS